ncbi:hypothetical protein, partial [Pseudovibrio axinellae]|uniref:hypothetical protein n=1 Tax=Pseudovibrio axinellae TaxID=989403 RepID=UPI000ADD81F1
GLNTNNGSSQKLEETWVSGQKVRSVENTKRPYVALLELRFLPNDDTQLIFQMLERPWSMPMRLLTNAI